MPNNTQHDQDQRNKRPGGESGKNQEGKKPDKSTSTDTGSTDRGGHTGSDGNRQR